LWRDVQLHAQAIIEASLRSHKEGRRVVAELTKEERAAWV